MLADCFRLTHFEEFQSHLIDALLINQLTGNGIFVISLEIFVIISVDIFVVYTLASPLG